jgi:hypothetical protein
MSACRISLFPWEIPVIRFLAGAAASFLFLTGAFLLWQSHAARSSALPSAPPARAASLFAAQQTLEAPEASPKSREEKRFSRYDHDKDGKVEATEYLAARQRNFDKLDADRNGALSFQEYAVKGIEKFNGAGGKKGWLSPAEFVKTAPPPPKHKSCSCGRAEPQVADASDD